MRIIIDPPKKGKQETKGERPPPNGGVDGIHPRNEGRKRASRVFSEAELR